MYCKQLSFLVLLCREFNLLFTLCALEVCHLLKQPRGTLRMTVQVWAESGQGERTDHQRVKSLHGEAAGPVKTVFRSE